MFLLFSTRHILYVYRHNVGIWVRQTMFVFPKLYFPFKFWKIWSQTLIHLKFKVTFKLLSRVFCSYIFIDFFTSIKSIHQYKGIWTNYHFDSLDNINQRFISTICHVNVYERLIREKSDYSSSFAQGFILNYSDICDRM